MSQLFDELICDKISLNEFKLWFQSSDCDQTLLQNTSKYEFIAYLLTNIRSSTKWLFQAIKESPKQQNCNNFTTNQTKDDNKLNVFKSDQNIDISKQRRNKVTENILKVKTLTSRVEKIDLNDENAFPGLSSESDVRQSVSPEIQKTIDTNVANNSQNTVQSRRTKRIKPTTIKGDDRISVGFFMSGRRDQTKGKPIVRKEFAKSGDNGFATKGNIESKPNLSPNDSLLSEREWLKRAKSQQFDQIFDKTNKQTFGSVSNPSPSKQETNRFVVIEAKPNSVTFDTQLDLISTLYILVLNSSFIPNYFEELKFICHLVTKRVFSERNEEIRNKFEEYFSSYNNCLYFSVKSLEQLLSNGLIHCLNKSVLKLLIDSTVLSQFDPNFHQKLVITFEVQQKSKSSDNYVTTLDSVLFQSETDNKNQFPNDNSFHSFRRQRDEFYKIFNSYRNKSTTDPPQHNTTKDNNLKFGNCIKHLISLANDCANLSHLTRLFVSQLLQSCVQKHLNVSSIGFNQQNSDFETTTDDNETMGQFADSERLKKLRKRFHQKKIQQNVCETKVFTKEEQFFRDFIIYGDSHAFNQNLKLLLCDKILVFSHKFDVFNSDFDSDSGDDRQELNEKIRNNLFTLKILSKFLGFTHFYPFDTHLVNNNINEFIESQTRLRSLQSRPSIDFEKYLQIAICDHKLITTIPWITEFLSFIDPISARIVYYEKLYNLLVAIHRSFVPQIMQSVANNGYFLLFCLTKALSNKSFDYENRFYRLVFNSSSVVNEKTITNSSKPEFDLMKGLIDSEFFNEYHQNISSELMEIFRQNVVANEVKKITPLSLPSINANHNKEQKNSNNIDKSDNKLNFEKQLILQIEEQFFNSHSPSLKKTVDFICDRITSKTIRRIKAEVYIKSKRIYVDTNPISDNKSNNFNDSELDFNAITQEIQKQCINFAEDYCLRQIETIFPLLMNEDIDESVSEFASNIAIKVTKEKCFDWIHKNITQNIIESDLKSEFKRVLSNNPQKIVETTEECVDICPTFTAVRDLMADLYKFESLEIESSVVVNLIHDLSRLRRCNALLPKTLKFIDVNIIDFLMALIANKPKLLSDSVMDLFINYWQEFHLIVDKYICPRNLYILSERSKSPFHSWNKYETMLLKMLSKELTTLKIIENDTLWTLKQEWNESALKRLGSCLKSVLENNSSHHLFDKNNELAENATIDWLSWFCSQSD